MKTFDEQVEHLIEFGAINRNWAKHVYKARAEHIDKTALEIVDIMGIRNLTHPPLDMVERFEKHIKENHLHDLKCYAVGLDTYGPRLVSYGMKLFKGHCPPTMINTQIIRMADALRDHVKAVHPGRELLLDNSIPASLLDEVEMLCAKNDKAHQMDHVYGVVCLAEWIIKQNDPVLGMWRTAVLLGALLHDVAHHLGRENHHEVGAELALRLLSTHMPDSLSTVELRYITTSIREHRSSFKSDRIHYVSEAVAAADLGVPNGKRYVERALVYQYSHYLNGRACLDGDESITREELETLFKAVIDHMLEKYSATGYSWNNVSSLTLNAWSSEVRRAQEFCGDPMLVRKHLCEEAWPKATKKLIGRAADPISYP